MKFYFEKDGKKEEVALERWTWGVVYKDGSELHQYERPTTVDGVFHQFAEIDRDNVVLFVMRNHEGKRFDIAIKEGQQIFHFYRNKGIGTANDKGETEIKWNRVYVFGYKDHKTKHTAYHFILPNDTLVIASEEIELAKFNL